LTFKLKVRPGSRRTGCGQNIPGACHGFLRCGRWRNQRAFFSTAGRPLGEDEGAARTQQQRGQDEQQQDAAIAGFFGLCTVQRPLLLPVNDSPAPLQNGRERFFFQESFRQGSGRLLLGSF
jgi:hypothetical protein